MIPIRLHITRIPDGQGDLETRLKLPDFEWSPGSRLTSNGVIRSSSWDAAPAIIGLEAMRTAYNPDIISHQFIGAYNASVSDCENEPRAKVLVQEWNMDLIAIALDNLVRMEHLLRKVMEVKRHCGSDMETAAADLAEAVARAQRDDVLKSFRHQLNGVASAFENSFGKELK